MSVKSMRLSSISAIACLLVAVLAAPAFLGAEGGETRGVSIQFDGLKVGTQLTIQRRGFSDSKIAETYVGKDGEHHVFEISEVQEDGSLELISRSHYDEAGREVFVVKDGKKITTFTPFSCMYVLGDCEHTSSYFNPFTDKYIESTSQYKNHRDGDTLYIGAVKSDGELLVVPYQLGAHNLRISNEYKNALDQDTGFSFVNLEIPE